MFNDSGFPKAMAYNDEAGGETSGLYASVTENEIVPNDSVLDELDAPSVFANIGDFLQGAQGLVTQVQQSKIQDAQAKAALARAQRPTLADQWDKLTSFEQISIVLGVAGFVYFAMHR